MGSVAPIAERPFVGLVTRLASRVPRVLLVVLLEVWTVSGIETAVAATCAVGFDVTAPTQSPTVERGTPGVVACQELRTMGHA